METTRFHRLVIDAVKDPLVLARMDGAIVLTNAAAESFLNIDAERNVDGLSCSDGGVRIDAAAIDEMMSRHESVRDYVLDGDSAAGVTLSIEPVRPDGGEEMRLLHFRRPSAGVDRDFWRDEMIAMVSHEIKNPLAAMKQSVDILLSGGPGTLTEGQRRFLDTSGRNIDRLTQLVDGFLDVSRIREGVFGLERTRVDMREFVEATVASFGALFNTRGVAIEHRVADDAVDTWVDAGKLEQVLVNLLSNAVKHTPESGAIRIDVDSAGIEAIEDDLRLLPWKDLGAPRLLRIRVADTGLGMSTDTLEHAFERYHTSSGGTGSHLGLNISRALVEAQGGRIEIESHLGIGTTVTMYLPQNPTTMCVITRMGRARRRLESYARARRSAAFLVLGKLTGDNWEDVASAWPTAPAVNPGAGVHVGTPLEMWTIDDGLAVAVAADVAADNPPGTLFGERFVTCADGSYVFNGFAVGMCCIGGDARGFTQVCSVAMTRMTGAREAMARAVDRRRDADLACVLNEWTRGPQL
jgi:signal transduction histidine kinase